MSNLPVLRDSRQRMLGGVCAGLARSWQVDPLLVRAGAVVVTVVTSGLGLLLYAALWIVIPLDAGRHPQRGLPRVLAGLALLVFVAGLMAPQSRGSTVGFAILAALGFVWYAASRAHRRRGRQAPAAPLLPHEPEPQWRQPPSAAHRHPVPEIAGGAYSWGPRRRVGVWRRVLLGIVVAWLALGGLNALGVRFGWVAYPAVTLAILGLTLALCARPTPVPYRRPRGLVAAGLVAALVTTAAMLPADPEMPTSSHISVASVSELGEPLDVGVGDHVVDLRQLTLDADAHLTITMDAGQLTILLPPELNVEARYTVGLGQVRTPNHRVSGVDASLTESYDRHEGSPTLHVTVDADLGDVEVRR